MSAADEPNELIGFTSDALRAEQRRRSQAHREGKCDACGAWYDTPACANLRHGDASETWIGRWQLDTGSTWLSASIDRSDGARLSISRYGVRVGLSRAGKYGGLVHGCADTSLPSDSLADRERFEWAIAWADAELLKIDANDED